MLVKVNGEIVAQLQGYAWTVLMMANQAGVKEALNGREVIQSIPHVSGRSINLLTSSP